MRKKIARKKATIAKNFSGKMCATRKGEKINVASRFTVVRSIFSCSVIHNFSLHLTAFVHVVSSCTHCTFAQIASPDLRVIVKQRDCFAPRNCLNEPSIYFVIVFQMHLMENFTQFCGKVKVCLHWNYNLTVAKAAAAAAAASSSPSSSSSSIAATAIFINFQINLILFPWNKWKCWNSCWWCVCVCAFYSS